MSVIRVGSSGTYANGWDAIFGGGRGRSGKKVAAKKAVAPRAAKKAKRSAKKAKRR